MVNLGELVFSIIAEDKASTTVGAVAAKIGQEVAAAGAAITAFGAGATLLIDRNREMDASFKTTALSMGVPAEAVKELARSLQSVDEPIGNVSRTLDLLARSGMENAETMGSTAAAFDLLGDAIGATSDEVAAAMVPAFKSLNVPLEEAPQHVDALTVAFREANIDLDGFADVMGEQGPALGEMGVSLEEAAAMMMIFAENGVVGENVSEQLNEAINNCDGSTTKLYKSLGMSSGQIAEYSSKLENSAGAAQEFADAQNSAYGTVDKLGFELDKLGQAAGDLLAPFEGVATAALAVGPAMTAAGSAASLLDNEMMVKLFPSLGKVTAGITGAGGLIPALAGIVPSAAGASTALTGVATAAGAVAIPLAALVATCALLGPAIDTVGQAWVRFLGATPASEIENLNEAWDDYSQTVITVATEQEKAAQIAAEASIQYDTVTGALIENAGALSTVEQAYDDFGNAITESNDAVAGSVIIYDEMGQIVGEMAPKIDEAATAAGDAAASFDEWGNAIEPLPGAIEAVAENTNKANPAIEIQNDLLEEAARRFSNAKAGADDYASSLSNLEIAQRTWNGTQATSLDYYKRSLAAGAPPDPGQFASPEGYMDALKEWQRKLTGNGKKSPSGTTPSSSPGSTEPTWAGKGDPDYTGGDPDAWKNDPRLNGKGAAATRDYVGAVKTVAPATNEANEATGRFGTTLSATESATRTVTPALATGAQAVSTLATTTAAAVPGLTYFRDAQGRLTDMVLQAPVPLNAEATAMSATATAAATAAPSILALERATIATATAATAAAPAATGAGTAIAGSGVAASAAATKVSEAQRAYDAAKVAADAANQKVTASAAALREAAAAGGQNATAIQTARAAYDAAKQAADAATQKLNASATALDAAKSAAAQLNPALATTAGNLNSVAGSANTAANSFVSMGRQYLTTRNSIQFNPITSIHTIRTIVEGGGANVAPGPSATKYYPKLHEGGTYQAPAGQSEGFAKLLDGERVLSRAETKEYEGGGIASAVAAGIAKGLAAVGLGSGGGDVIVHGDVKLSEDYSYDRFREDVGRWKSSRIAKGVLS